MSAPRERVDPVRRVDREAVGRRHARVLGRGHLEVELRHARLGAVDAVDLAGHGHLEHVHRGERQDDDALHRLLRGHGRNLAHRGSPATRRGSGRASRSAHGRNELIDRYERGPAEVRDALDGITAFELDRRPAPDAWTAREVVHHLADSETNSYITAPATPRRGRGHDRRVRRGRVGPAPRLRPADRAQPGGARCRASGDGTAAPHARRRPSSNGPASTPRAAATRSTTGWRSTPPTPTSMPTRSDEPEKVGPDARPPLPCPRPPRPARPRRHHLGPQRHRRHRRGVDLLLRPPGPVPLRAPPGYRRGACRSSPRLTISATTPSGS